MTQAGEDMVLERVLFLRPLHEREIGVLTFARRGVEIVIADHPGSELFGLGDRQIPVDTLVDAFRRGDMSAVEDRIVRFHQQFPLTGITADFDYLLPTVGRLNDRLGLRGHTARTGAVCADKRSQRAMLDKAGVPGPAWRTFTTRAGLSRAAAELGFPVVVKPADRSNSAAVVYAGSEAELDAAYQAVLDQSWTGGYLVERYLDGPEVSVEAITQAGRTSVIAVVAKEIGHPPRFLKLGAEVPAELPERLRGQVHEVAVAAVGALGISDAPTHTELRLTRDGPQVIEVNARIGGLFLAHMVLAATGINLYGAWCDVLHGRTPDLTPSRAAVAVRRCVSEGVGEVTAVVVGDEPVRLAAEHVETRCYVRPGSVLRSIEDNFGIRAVHVACAPTRAAAVAAADRLAGTLDVHFAPVSGRP
ncbi:ATP-grasp domain-containing protein [Amycolatopsis pigmentata]|uniref:Acetyl-CoA carboxylase biotin carboxylase subunit family protein n=1 Tax=Amycolatopsis pigmentata TaxID=450801 RepID=A0ABW5FKD9_9PSEU